MRLKDIYYALNKKMDIIDVDIKEIKTDSRKINNGDIFIAIVGEKYNGNEFVLEAIKRGAILCICQKIMDKCLYYEDSMQALFLIANYIRNKYNIPLIAITGSNGKTTTKELIAHILSKKYNVLKNEASKNNLIGISETLFKLNGKHDIGVLELGTNHIGEILNLSNLVNPNYSIITNIGSSHLQYFKTKKNIFKEKYSIIQGSNDKKIIVNGDSKYLNKLNCFKCGFKKYNDLYAYNIVTTESNVKFSIRLENEYNIVFNNPGQHFIIDVLLAIKVCLDYKMKMKDIIKRIRTFKLPNKRMSVIKCKSNTIINDCYNASFESIVCGVNYLKTITGKKKIILGDILELGKYSKRIHKRLNKYLYEYEVLTVGRYTKYIKGKHFSSSYDLVDYLKMNQINNSYIYIKGSRRMNLDYVVDYLCD